MLPSPGRPLSKAPAVRVACSAVVRGKADNLKLEGPQPKLGPF